MWCVPINWKENCFYSLWVVLERSPAFFFLLLAFRNCAIVCLGVLICCGTIRNSLLQHTKGMHTWERLAASVERPATACGHTQSTWTRCEKGSFYTHRILWYTRQIYKEIPSFVFKKCPVLSVNAPHDIQRNFYPRLGAQKSTRWIQVGAFWSTDEVYQTNKQRC